MYIQSDTLLLADVFENFRNMCFKICEFDPIRFLNEPSSVWQENTFKKFSFLDLLTNVDMLLMVRRGIRGGIFQSIY